MWDYLRHLCRCSVRSGGSVGVREERPQIRMPFILLLLFLWGNHFLLFMQLLYGHKWGGGGEGHSSHWDGHKRDVKGWFTCVRKLCGTEMIIWFLNCQKTTGEMSRRLFVPATIPSVPKPTGSPWVWGWLLMAANNQIRFIFDAQWN